MSRARMFRYARKRAFKRAYLLKWLTGVPARRGGRRSFLDRLISFRHQNALHQCRAWTVDAEDIERTKRPARKSAPVSDAKIAEIGEKMMRSVAEAIGPGHARAVAAAAVQALAEEAKKSAPGA